MFLVIMSSYNVKSIFNFQCLVYEKSELLNVTCSSNLLSPDWPCSAGKGCSLAYELLSLQFSVSKVLVYLFACYYSSTIGSTFKLWQNM